MKIKLFVPLLAAVGTLFVATIAPACMGMSHDHGGDAHASAAIPAATTSESADSLLQSYHAIRGALSADSLDGVATEAELFGQTVKAELAGQPEEKKGAVEKITDKTKPFLKKGLKIAKKIPCGDMAAGAAEKMLFSDDEYSGRAVLERLQKAALTLAGGDIELKTAREAFGDLSDAFVEYLGHNVDSDYSKGFQLYFCEMAKHHWIQPVGEDIANPYFGREMADCGEKVALFGGGEEKTGHNHGN